MTKKVVILGGGTVFHVRNHLAICAPAYGSTAKYLAQLSSELLPNLECELKLTKMAGGPLMETNEDVETVLNAVVADPTTKIVILSCALCDFSASLHGSYGKYSGRLPSRESNNINLQLKPVNKLIAGIRRQRKDIFLVGFKTTCNLKIEDQYQHAIRLCKEASCNLVFANDPSTRMNMVVCPEEAHYHLTTERNVALRGLMEMVALRSNLTFTRSTVVDGKPIPWDSSEVPSALRAVVNYCIQQRAYKPINGVTAGHFAVKLSDDTFLTSIRKSDFNSLDKIGLVRIKTDGPDTVLAFGAKPSVGGQSQRIVFRDHPGLHCIVHFHCQIKPESKVPIVSQREYECGSMQCGENTSKGLKQFGNIHAVYLDNHGPNIVFSKYIDPQEVIRFIQDNFDLNKKTDGFQPSDLKLGPDFFRN